MRKVKELYEKYIEKRKNLVEDFNMEQYKIHIRKSGQVRSQERLNLNNCIFIQQMNAFNSFK